mmetsp:Transcript_5158/g.14473  ORF Transcript_5158/g.14473 Transcript_5158/m.14473 type:complete len:301 (-) Transcript_5158:130-1032(-)
MSSSSCPKPPTNLLRRTMCGFFSESVSMHLTLWARGPYSFARWSLKDFVMAADSRPTSDSSVCACSNLAFKARTMVIVVLMCSACEYTRLSVSLSMFPLSFTVALKAPKFRSSFARCIPQARWKAAKSLLVPSANFLVSSRSFDRSSVRFSSSVVRPTRQSTDTWMFLAMFLFVSLKPSPKSLNSFLCSSNRWRLTFASSRAAFAAPSVSANFAWVSARSVLMASFCSIVRCNVFKVFAPSVMVLSRSARVLASNSLCRLCSSSPFPAFALVSARSSVSWVTALFKSSTWSAKGCRVLRM